MRRFPLYGCDRARGEECPVWPGQPITAHWGVSDPAPFAGTDVDKHRSFKRVYTELENRVKLSSSLRPDQIAIPRNPDEIGKTKGGE